MTQRYKLKQNIQKYTSIYIGYYYIIYKRNKFDNNSPSNIKLSHLSSREI